MRASSILWEFLQNALFVLPFVGAFWLWRESNVAGAMVCVAMSGIAGPVSMYCTETFTTGKPTALLGSIIAGMVSSIAQYWISGGTTRVFHAIAMFIASTICLLSFRLVISRSSSLQIALGYATLVVLLVSVIVVSIDYARGENAMRSRGEAQC